MPANLSAVNNLSGGACEITLTGETGSVTFDVHHINIPTDAYICLLEVSTIGVALSDLGKNISANGTDEEKVERMRGLQSQIESVKTRFRNLPRLLASVVTWQDVKDGDKEIVPSEGFFAGLPIELQAQYAGGLIAKKQPTTANSSATSPNGSIPKASTEAVPPTSSLTAPPSITDAPDGNSLLNPTP